MLAHHDPATRATLGDEVAGTGITIIGEASTGTEALDLALELVPDVAVLAVALADLDGVEVCRRLRADLPACRVLLLTDADDEAALGGLTAGAYGCYLLGDQPVSLVKAIRGTMRRESLPTPRWAAAILEQYAALEADEGDRLVPAPRLSPTEAEVLTRLAEGRSPSQIAKMHDVTTHLVRLYAGYAIIKLYRAVSDEALLQSVQ